MKKIISKILRSILSLRLYRLCANGMYVVPSYYKAFIQEAEKNFGYILADSVGKDMLLARKYGHILDKGIQRPDAESGHSYVYYEGLKKFVSRLDKEGYAEESTVVWMKEKLQQYERLQEHGKLSFDRAEIFTSSEPDYDRLCAIIRGRRSNRQFLNKRVDYETIRKILSVVDWSASSCNKQPVKVFFANDTRAAKCLKCCAGGTGFSEYIPLFLAFTADIRGYVWPSEIMLPYVDVSLGAQNLFLAAHTLGISGTILSWAQKTPEQEQKLRLLLDIPESHQIVFCAVMGYAAYEYEAPARKVQL